MIGVENLMALEEYKVSKKLPNSFLLAVLCNDLMAVINRGDENALSDLPAIVRYLKNNYPSDAWGSYETVSSYAGKPLYQIKMLV